jgi:hypothetical protein
MKDRSIKSSMRASAAALAVSLVIMTTGCASRGQVDCDARLAPINAPAPVKPPASASTGSATKPIAQEKAR